MCKRPHLEPLQSRGLWEELLELNDLGLTLIHLQMNIYNIVMYCRAIQCQSTVLCHMSDVFNKYHVKDLFQHVRKRRQAFSVDLSSHA